MQTRTMPMFPLGSPLLPRMVLPLHVFEPRFQELMERVLEQNPPEFGVVMIERGHEVGGGDTRAPVGTIARVLQAEREDDGRYLVVGVGTRRIRVHEWLPDDPFPCARVEEWDDPLGAPPAVVTSLLDTVEPRLRQVLSLASQLGHDLPDGDLADDLVTASYQASILAPLSAFDMNRLLAAESVADRFHLLYEELEGLTEVLKYRLATETNDLE